MKTYIWLLIFLFPALSFAQETSKDTIHAETWQEVHRLMAIKNYSQTLPLLADIKASAKQNNNHGEWIRAVMAENLALSVNNTHDNTFLIINDHFEEHIRQTKGAEHSILQNFYAQHLYNHIYRYHTDSDDPFTAQDYAGKTKLIDSLFSLSLSQREMLTREPIQNWHGIFVEQKNSSLTPTLFHFLAHAYLNFLDNIGNQQIEKKASLIKELEQLNKLGTYNDATAYLMSYRLSINYWNYDNELPKFLNIIDKQHSNYNAYLLYQIAEARRNQNPAEALKHLDRALENHPQSPWINEVKNLLNNIKKTDIELTHDLYAPANRYTPIKISTRNTNTDSLYIRVYNTTNNPKNYRNYDIKYDSTTFDVSLDAALVYEEAIPQKALNNYETQQTIYKLNPLSYGRYTILLANNQSFKDDGLYLDVTENQITISDVFISATIDGQEDKQELYKTLLINRKTGTPYNKKKVQLYETSSTTAPKLIQTFTTNDKGEFSYTTNYAQDRNNLNDYELFLPAENQLIDLNRLNHIESHVPRDNPYASEDNMHIQTMTDRAIYRPGQTIYFKSILYNGHPLLGGTLDNQEVRVSLYDTNNQQIDTLTLSTNAFGSVHGSFLLPNKTLTGSFRLVATHGKRQLHTQRIRVEEYKRPTFKASFDVNKETYTLRDTAIFTGLAETLSGVPLVDASVRYKVSFYHPSQGKTVIFADTTTNVDDQGKFRITVPLMDSLFVGLTDFTLQYSAEVVNQTGEMQAASGSYRFADKPWNIRIQTEYAVEERRWKEINIHTVNQNGQPLKFSGKVDIYKYDLTPRIALTDKDANFFREADYHTLSEAEYNRYFPHYFDPIFLYEEYPKTKVASYDFDTRDTGLIQLDSTLFANGHYWVEAYTVQEGDTVRASTNVSLYKAGTKKVTETEFFIYSLDKEQYSIGDKVTITFETDVPNAKKIYLFEAHGSKKSETKVLNWKNGKAQYSFTLQKEHISPNLFFTALLLVDNKAATVSVYVPIQRNDKALTIKTSTFRDKITPGQTEKWSFTITKKDQAVQAEVLATMYDAALDGFASNSFPTTLQLSAPYYGRLDFYYLLREFQRTEESTGLFYKQHWYNAQGNDISIVYSYGLLPGRNLIVNTEGVLEEVAIVGYGQPKRVTMGASLARVSSEGFATGSTKGVEGVDIRGGSINDVPVESLYVIDGEIMDTFDLNSIDASLIAHITVLKDAAATATYGSRGANGVIIVTTKEGLKKQAQLDAVKARTDLKETAFFYPQLYSDTEGNISFEFDSPEALSRWKLLLFAHSKNLDAGSATFFTQTQKQLMVRPNLPRYFREGDKMTLKAQVQNISKNKLSGNARIEIINPENNENITGLFLDGNNTTPFDIAAENNSIVEWQLRVPAGYPTVQIKIVAATDEFSDGEQHELPILPNKILISDTEKIILKPNERQEYHIQGENKENLHAKVQVQTNPILEILSALDYLKNYPYECTEQTSSRWFALQMARYIQKNYPAISNYFVTLNQENTKGRLEENSSLSELTLEEMPWLRDIQGEESRRRAIARLFGSNIQADISDLERKLSKSQLPDGHFPWFEGGKPNTAISIRILEITGKVLQLDHTLVSSTMRQSMQKLTTALDKDSTLFDSKRHSMQVLDYLYARQYWNGLYTLDHAVVQKLNNDLQKSPEVTAQNAAGIAAKAWVVNQILGDAKQTGEIKNRITQEVIHDSDKGMYWESNQNRFNAISLHSYMVEAYKFHDPSKLYEITQWIYYNKQANHWRSTWATVDAIYALLLANDPQDFSLENTINIWVDQKEVTTKNVVLGQSTKDFNSDELRDNRTVSIQNNNNRRVFGSLVHQYFGSAEEVSSSTNAISVQKQYFVERQGEWVQSNTFELGEKIKVKITLINDSPLEYVHLKDARPSAVEPLYRPSGYQWWQGHYFSLKDASTNYFFDYLPKGKRELEYEVKANNSGIFHAGITTVECMYDPAVRARSGSILVIVKGQ